MQKTSPLLQEKTVITNNHQQSNSNLKHWNTSKKPVDWWKSVSRIQHYSCPVILTVSNKTPDNINTRGSRAVLSFRSTVLVVRLDAAVDWSQGGVHCPLSICSGRISTRGWVLIKLPRYPPFPLPASWNKVA